MPPPAAQEGERVVIPLKHKPAAALWAVEHVQLACDEMDDAQPDWPMIAAHCAMAIAKSLQGLEGDGDPPRHLLLR